MATMLSIEIAEKLENKMKYMKVGEKLPSERNLAEELGVSRNMLRESLRVLSEKGVIEILPGKGAYVANRQEDRIADRLTDILFDSRSNLIDIVEVRKSIEMETCLKAVQVAYETDIQQLEKLYDLMEKSRKYVVVFNEYDMSFHMQIAKASHNSIYPLLLGVLYNMSDKKLFRITELYPTRVDSAQKEHRALIEAIRSHDRKAMKSVANKHFDIQDILSLQDLIKTENNKK